MNLETNNEFDIDKVARTKSRLVKIGSENDTQRDGYVHVCVSVVTLAWQRGLSRNDADVTYATNICDTIVVANTVANQLARTLIITCGIAPEIEHCITT